MTKEQKMEKLATMSATECRDFFNNKLKVKDINPKQYAYLLRLASKLRNEKGSTDVLRDGTTGEVRQTSSLPLREAEQPPEEDPGTPGKNGTECSVERFISELVSRGEDGGDHQTIGAIPSRDHVARIIRETDSVSSSCSEERIQPGSQRTNHPSRKSGVSQKARLLSLLSDGEWHTSPEIIAKVYGDKLTGARYGARVNDLKNEGHEIESEKVEGSLWRYRLNRNRENVFEQIANNIGAA